MNTRYDPERDHAYLIKPWGFLVFYFRHGLIWGKWSLAQTRYDYRRAREWYEQRGWEKDDTAT